MDHSQDLVVAQSSSQDARMDHSQDVENAQKELLNALITLTQSTASVTIPLSFHQRSQLAQMVLKLLMENVTMEHQNVKQEPHWLMVFVHQLSHLNQSIQRLAQMDLHQ